MYLGVDIGTSALKVVLVDENGKTVHSCSNDLSVQRPRPGWSEQDPHSWWQAADHAVKTLHLTCAKQLQLIALLDTARDLLEEISPELGVTDPVSGTVVFERGG